MVFPPLNIKTGELKFYLFLFPFLRDFQPGAILLPSEHCGNV